jgi:signal transduction histidine kinase/CheY-like chemotaxis protein
MIAAAAPAALDDRVLLLAPTRKDATTTAALLGKANIAVHACASFDEAVDEIGRGAAVLVLPEEAITPERNDRLAAWLATQPPWSDLPVLVLTLAGADSAASGEAVRTLGNVTLLERPVRLSTLLSAVRTALRARERQYQIRRDIDERGRIEEALRLADQRKDEFLAALGHELRNPLSPLVSGVHHLRLTTRDAQTLGILPIFERQLAHLVRLVDDLLEVSRITRGLIQVRHVAIDLVAVVRDAVETSRSLIVDAGHEVVFEPAAPRLLVRGDAVRLTQIIANLLTNAAKYTNAGGRIQVGVERRDDSAVMWVRDTGIGIAPAHLTSVFEMFMQVDRSNRRAQGGLGIGLTLVRTLVDLHGGRVEALSDGLGTGSTFVVTLPLLDDVVADAGAGVSPRAFPSRRILVVDDNRDAADTLASVLTALGAVVSIAYDGPSGLDRLDRFAPDAVLLDIGMPGMDGYQVARTIRRRPGPQPLLIALTGWGQEQDLRDADAAGFDHHLVKPPDLDKLRALLETRPPPRSATSLI